MGEPAPRRLGRVAPGTVVRAAVAGATALLAAVALAGCSAVSTLTSTPTITEITANPDEITPTADLGPPPSSKTSTGSPAPATAGTADSSGPVADGPRSTERLVVVDDPDIAFAAPVLFTSIDPEGMLDQAGGAEALDELAKSKGISPAQLRNALLNQADQLLYGPAEQGFQTNILVARSPLPFLPTPAQLRAQLSGTLGAEVTEAESIATAAGPGLRLSYAVPLGKRKVHGQIVLVRTPQQIVSVTASAASAKTTEALAERVVATIRLPD